MFSKSVRLIALLLAFHSSIGSAAEPDSSEELKSLAGVWLPDSAEMSGDNYLGRVWLSKLIIQDNRFALDKLMFHPKDLTGTIQLDGKANPKTIDLRLNEFDFTEIGMPAKIPACTISGIYKIEAGKLVFCFACEVGGKRPTSFVSGRRQILFSMGRADAKYKAPPETVVVSVKTPEGTPASGATTFAFMFQNLEKDRKSDNPEWKYTNEVKADKNGNATVKYIEINQGLSARVPDQKLIGIASASPYSLQSGKLTIELKPEVKVKGTLTSEALKKAGQEIDWTNTSLRYKGTSFADSSSFDGTYEFIVPAGEYSLVTNGADLQRKISPLIVPNDRSEYNPAPINHSASVLVGLKGKPAPELKNVLGWKGNKVNFADLKGKIVLLEFWGYWCGPCVVRMPKYLDLHDQFKDKGLVIVGVHVDIDGEVDTAAKLDEKLVDIRKQFWKGRDIPFSVALCSGKEPDVGGGVMRRGGPPDQYGILRYPTAILIDRKGNVVGRFEASDTKQAIEMVEKLLAEK